jgi:hypothetical protein
MKTEARDPQDIVGELKDGFLRLAPICPSGEPRQLELPVDAYFI